MAVNKDAKKTEEQWFHDQDRKLLQEMQQRRKARAREQAEREAAARREELRQLHWLCCPKCGHGMEERDLMGIQVDVCTACEGIFFDRGELEGLLVRQAGKDGPRGFFRRLLGVGDD